VLALSMSSSIIDAGLAWGYDLEAVEAAVCKLLAKRPDLDGPEDIGPRYPGKCRCEHCCAVLTKD